MKCIAYYSFLFLLFKMYQKVSNIELGGGYKGSSVNTNTHYRANGPFFIAQGNLTQIKSKEIIVSTHKIPGKVSPGKYKIYSHQTSRHGSVLENENGFLQMKDSSISSPVHHMVKVKSPLRDASNISPSNIQSRQFVRVNFINNSPECSRTPSTHLREFKQSPSKMVTCIAADKDTRGQVLERKMKVLEGRIGELHKEKQEMMGRLNEQSRKVYHQNTALKLKVSELMKRLEKEGGTNASSDNRSEMLALQQDKQKLEDAVMLLNQNNSKLSQQNHIINNQLNECTEEIKELSANLQKVKDQKLLSHNLKELQQENEQIKQAYQQKQNDYDALHSQYLQLSQEKLEFLSIKQKYQHDLNEIRQSINENNVNQNMIIKEYQGKLDEYKQAYDKNQEIIEQLSFQLQESQQYSSQDIYPNSYDEVVGESEGELAIQCKNLENNFLMALDEKDHMIATLQASKEAMANELVTKDQIIDELSTKNNEQAGKLEKIGTILERYTLKMKEMESKYEQLWQKYEQEKQRNESSFNAQKCRKCQELTKTIFRLNSHLNKRT